MLLKYYKIETLGYCLEYYYKYEKWPQKTAVITIDDGYRDFFLYAFPELKKRNIKATFFVTVEFVNKNIWLWPDKVFYAILNSEKKNIKIDKIEKNKIYPLETLKQKIFFNNKFCEYCKKIRDDEKKDLIFLLEKKLQVNSPELPVDGFEAITWDELKYVSQYGIEIGSHTMTHPILSKVSIEKLTYEIKRSKEVIEEMIEKPLKSFCYPNSLPQDITEEVVQVAKDSGYLGGVHNFGLRKFDPYLIPRVGVSNHEFDFSCKTNRFEQFGFTVKNLMK
ncbi:hypothetical protein JCM12296A_58520 [Desulfosarcina cetonica]|uniref:polysaccharide deacetylase family protein n=1 Tax=Desulfosarcina cetonica TaxID=90730 RepID=UPI00155DA4C7|nr:polysaccharide deacetylase family protein [Desulfosarcina cetonica]